MLFSNAKAKKKKTGLFFWMKVNLSQKAMKLGPNDNWGTVGVSEMNSSCLFQAERYLTLLKPKKLSLFLFPFRQSMKVWNQISVKSPWS